MISFFHLVINILIILIFLGITFFAISSFFLGLGNGLGLGLIISIILVPILLYLKNLLLNENKRPRELEELVRVYKKGEISRISFFKSVINTISFLNILLFIPSILWSGLENWKWPIIFGVTGAILFYLKIRLKRAENKNLEGDVY